MATKQNKMNSTGEISTTSTLYNSMEINNSYPILDGRCLFDKFVMWISRSAVKLLCCLYCFQIVPILRRLLRWPKNSLKKDKIYLPIEVMPIAFCDIIWQKTCHLCAFSMSISASWQFPSTISVCNFSHYWRTSYDFINVHPHTLISFYIATCVMYM